MQLRAKFCVNGAKRAVMILLGVLLIQGPSLTQAQQNPITVRSVVIRPHGFEPSKMTVKAGRVLIAVYNLSTLPDVSLQVDKVGTRVLDAQIARGKRSTRQTLDLTPGTYVLKDPRVPKWTCQITVAP